MSREDVQLGRVDADHDDGYLYRLPYGDDVSFPIIQGYGAKLSHRGAERFTLDFGMPVGTPVHAARDGVVVLVEDSHDVGCAREECGRFANFVVVLHSDGTTGEYFHLERGSVQVRVGERVARGQRSRAPATRGSARRRICTSASIARARDRDDGVPRRPLSDARRRGQRAAQRRALPEPARLGGTSPAGAPSGAGPELGILPASTGSPPPPMHRSQPPCRSARSRFNLARRHGCSAAARC